MSELISIIIPVYNVEKYLKRCLESVINQTYRNLEIILVDDGSKDSSGKICDEYAEQDKRIKVIHKKNGGASSARNMGLDIAQGNYIGFIDSDDWIELDMYEYLHKLIVSLNVDIAMCEYVCVKKEIKYKKKKEDIKVYEDINIFNFFYRMNGEKSFYSVWNRLYKKDCVEKIRFLENKITEDVDYTYNAYKRAKKVAVSNLSKYYYFINNYGVTRGRLSYKDLDLLTIWDNLVEQEKGTKNYQNTVLNRKRATFTLYCKGLLYGVDSEVKQLGLMKQWKKEIKENSSIFLVKGIFSKSRKLLIRIICLF